MKLTSSKVRITPKKADELLRLNTYEGQRNKSQRHIQELAEKMKDGRFHVGSIALIHNGKVEMADGQHQCEACKLAGVPFTAMQLDYVVEEDDTKEDIAEVFAQFNVDRSRSRGDIAWIYGCKIGMADWPRKCVTVCNSALGWIAGGCSAGGGVNIPKDENSRLLSSNRELCQFVHDIAFGENASSARHIIRSPVVAAMMQTRRANADAAATFWSAVRDGDMLKKSDPAYKLREFLLRSKVKSSSGSRDTEVVDQRTMYGKCIVAWNAYRTGNTTALKYFSDKPLPQPK